MYFRYYGVGKKWLYNCLKSLVSGNPSRVKMLKGPKHCLNLHESTFIIFFITLGEIEFENVSVSDI